MDDVSSWQRAELEEIQRLDLPSTPTLSLQLLVAFEAARRRGLSFESTKAAILARLSKPDRGGE